MLDHEKWAARENDLEAGLHQNIQFCFVATQE